MAKVTGIGGLFFRARDPAALALWYETHLGIGSPQTTIWRQEAGITVFAPLLPKTPIISAGGNSNGWSISASTISMR